MSARRRPLVSTGAALLAVAALALVLAACGDSEETTVAETETTTSTESGTTATEQTGETTATDGAPPPADVTVDESAAFVTTTEPIACFIDKMTVRCDIDEPDWKPPAAPADCKLDHGHGISLTAGSGAEFVCAGDTMFGSGGETLEDGQSISAGLLRCESATDGITCTDTENGRGFFLSRKSYEIF